jgi:anti-anti-sigma factor
MTSRPVGEATIVQCCGSLLLGKETDSLRELVRKLLPESPTIVIDLAEVTAMDSGGMGTLVGLHYSARSAGARIRLAHLPARIRTLFELTRLLSVFDIVESPEQAAIARGTQA